MAARHWFETARFGMFIHWGQYSQHGWEPSWPLVGPNPALPHYCGLTTEEYFRDASKFAPEPGAAREWVRLARRCGMRYAVLTTKHHDGYALFRSPHADFGVEHSACGRDLVAEFADAARAEGLRVGFYFSLIDWHHPDYPAWNDSMRPYPFLLYPRPEPERWRCFLDVMFAQIEHLLTAYGKIDLLWFDGGWERTPDEWRAKDLEALIRRLQPEIVINDRLPGVGDYETPEQTIPARGPSGWWETCMTMNESWGNIENAGERKSVRHILGVLAEVAGRGGNLLLNVSPDGAGRIPDWQRERLAGVAAWMERHGEAIHECERGLEPGQFYGPTTRKGDRTFLFCTMRPQELVVLRGVPVRRVRGVRAIGSGVALRTTERISALDAVMNSDPVGDLLIHVPEEAIDPLLTVIEVLL